MVGDSTVGERNCSEVSTLKVRRGLVAGRLLDGGAHLSCSVGDDGDAATATRGLLTCAARFSGLSAAFRQSLDPVRLWLGERPNASLL
mgnify:CR=1 FL=1